MRVKITEEKLPYHQFFDYKTLEGEYKECLKKGLDCIKQVEQNFMSKFIYTLKREGNIETLLGENEYYIICFYKNVETNSLNFNITEKNIFNSIQNLKEIFKELEVIF